MKITYRHLLPCILAGSIASSLEAQTFWTGGSNSWVTPGYRGGSGSEYAQWDILYNPSLGTNYPDVAGIGAEQTFTAAGMTPPPGSSVGAAITYFLDPANPTITQVNPTSGAFIIGAGSSGNIYSFSGTVALELADTVASPLGTANFQWQTDGTTLDFGSLKLMYNNGTEDVFLSPVNMINEYKGGVSAFGFALTNRGSAQWNLTGLGITSYKIVWVAAGSSSSQQEFVLDTATTYSEATPGNYAWTGGGGDNLWSTAGNWGGALPSTAANVTIGSAAGSTVTIDGALRTVSELTLDKTGGLTVNATGGGALKINSGITLTPDAAGTFTIDAPLTFGAFNLIAVNENSSVVVTSDIDGNAGFYKEGDGELRLLGNLSFGGTGGIAISGGTNYLGGTNNTYTDNTNVLDGTLVVMGGASLPATTKLVLGFGNPVNTSGKIVLGDVGGAANVTVAGLESALLGAEAGQATIDAFNRNAVVGGSAVLSTLTVTTPNAHIYYGHLGGSGAHENNLALVKYGAGSIALFGANTFSGGATINGGTLQVDGDGSFGTGALAINGGGVKYGASFDNLRAFTMGASGATLDTNGFDATYAHVLTGPGALTKAGGGILTLTGSNSFAGALTVSGGYVAVAADDALGAVVGSPTANKIVLHGNGGISATESFAIDANRGIGLGTAAGAGAGNIHVAPTKTLSYNGVIANTGSGAGGLIKAGKGTLALTGGNTYTGATQIYEGTLRLDFANSTRTSNIVASGSALQLFGGDLAVVGKTTGAVSQTFGATTLIGSGHSNLKADSNGGSGTTVALNALSRSAGATVNFDLPAAGSVTTSTATAINGVITSAATNGVAYATVNNTDWAALSGGNIVALAAYETSTTPADWAAAENVALSGNATGVNTATINSLKLAGDADVALNGGQTLTLTTGGILVTGTGASSITGGTIRGANGTAAATRELVVFQNNTADAFTIGSMIANSSANATAFTKTGEGTLVLTAVNTYTGVTRLTGGTVEVASLTNGNAASTLGQSTNTAANLVIDGATLKYTGAGNSTDRLFTLGINGATIDASGTGAVTFSNTGSLGLAGSNYARTLMLAGSNTGDNTLNAMIANNGAGATALVKDGAGAWLLNPGSAATSNSAFTGGVFINAGVLKIGKAGALNNTGANTVTFAGSAPAGTALVLNGSNAFIAGLGGSGSGSIVENASATASTLSINTGADFAYAGQLRDGTGGGALTLVKSGQGRQTLSGANAYSGGTTINGGTLVAAHDNALGRGGATVNNYGTLVIASGITVANAITLNAGGELTLNGALSAAVTFAGGTLSGSGSLNQAFTVGDGPGELAQLSPGNSPGAMNTLSETWDGGGSYLWEIKDVDSGLGLGWDHLNITGTLTLTADSNTPFTIEIASLTAGDLAGAVGDFFEASDYTWTIATASEGIIGFDSSDFLIDTTGFVNPCGGTFTIAQSGNDLALHYAAPEPSSALLFATSGLWLLGVRRRRPVQR